MTPPRNKFTGWADKPKPDNTRLQVVRVLDGDRVLGTVDRIGRRYESFDANQRFIGQHASRDAAVQAIHGQHQAGSIVNGLIG